MAGDLWRKAKIHVQELKQRECTKEDELICELCQILLIALS